MQKLQEIEKPKETIQVNLTVKEIQNIKAGLIAASVLRDREAKRSKDALTKSLLKEMSDDYMRIWSKLYKILKEDKELA